MVAGIDGSGRVVGYRAVEIMACAGNGCVGVMYHKLLAECVDEVLDASRDGYFERLDTLYGHRVADCITPQSVARCDCQCVGVTRLDFPCRKCLGERNAGLVDGDELVECGEVEKQHHGVVVYVVLEGEEPFGGIVGFEITHARRIGYSGILFAIGFKRYSSVEKYFEIGPHIVNGVGSGLLDDVLYDGHEPRRHTRYVGDVFVHRGLDKRRKLFVPLLHECDTLGWHSHEIDQRVYAVDEVGR